MPRKKVSDVLSKAEKNEQTSLADLPEIDEKTREVLSGESQGRGSKTPEQRTKERMEKLNKTISVGKLQNGSDDGFNVSTSLNLEKTKGQKKTTTTKKTSSKNTSKTKTTKASTTKKKKVVEEEKDDVYIPYDGEAIPESIDPSDEFVVDELTGEVVGKKTNKKTKKTKEVVSQDLPSYSKDEDIEPVGEPDLNIANDYNYDNIVQEVVKPEKKTTTKKTTTKKKTSKKKEEPKQVIVSDYKKSPKDEKSEVQETIKEEKVETPAVEENKEEARLEAMAKFRGVDSKDKSRRKAMRLHRKKLSVLDAFGLTFGILITLIGGAPLLYGLYQILWLGNDTSLLLPLIITGVGVVLLYKFVKLEENEEQKWDE